MSQELFEEAISPEISAFSQALNDLESDEIGDHSEFPALYRRLCQRLALARHRRYSANLVQRLNALVVRGHQQLYRRDERTTALDRVATVLVHEFPRSLRARPGPLALSCVLFFGVALLTFGTIVSQPDLVHAILSPMQIAGMERMYDPDSTHFLRPREADGDLAMFAFYIRNNVGIGLRTFGAGLALAVGTIYVLVFNGLVLAAVAAHLHNIGFGETFWPFVAGHAALELGAIAVAGAAGLRLGLALVKPGLRTRALAIREEAAAVVPVVCGFAAMLVLAAVVEAFWSSQHQLGDTTRFIAGSGLLVFVLAWLGWGGRHAD